jgi:hypothetical protein
VTDRGTVGVVASFGAGQPLDVSVQQAPQHPQTGPHREREQALAGGAGQLGERDRDLFGQDQLGVGGQGRLRMLGHVAVPSGRASWRMPDTYHTAGIRRGPPPQVLRSPGQPPAKPQHHPGIPLEVTRPGGHPRGPAEPAILAPAGRIVRRGRLGGLVHEYAQVAWGDQCLAPTRSPRATAASLATCSRSVATRPATHFWPAEASSVVGGQDAAEERDERLLLVRAECGEELSLRLQRDWA